MSNFRGRKRQAGVALITVLLVFAIASLIASKIIIGKVLDVQRTTGMVNRTQAYYYALAAEELAILALQEDAIQDAENSPQGDNLDEYWAQGPVPFEIDNIGAVLVNIVDLNRFYNVNNLFQVADGKVNLHELDRFKDLLIALDIDDTIADNLRDWIDEDSKEEGYQSEKEGYANSQPGYSVANTQLSDVSELRLIHGFTPEVMAKLLPHITVIKTDGIVALNINTASDYALTSLQASGIAGNSGKYEGIGYTRAQDLESLRSEPFVSAADVTARASIANLVYAGVANPGSQNTANPATSQALKVVSDYYEINIRSSYAGSIAYLSTIVKQDGFGDSAKFIVLSRRENDNSSRLLQAAGS